MKNKPEILLVDDKAENLVAFERVLADLGAHFVRATSGNEALALLLEHDFSIALIDVQMPGMDGFETVELMRLDQRGKHLPVIFVSAIYKDEYHQIKGIETGAVDFITKPIVPQILRGKVRTFIDLYKYRVSLEEEVERRMEAEVAIHVQYGEIEVHAHELEAANDELQTACLKLQELDKMKDDLLSKVSHELRTPLTSIKSFTEILLTYGADEKDGREFLNIINDESDRLTRLINDFLDLSKIGSGRMKWETTTVEISEIISIALHASEALFAKMGLEVDIELSPDLPGVMGDKDRFVQVLTNLLSNAAKFTPDGGRILVKAEPVRQDKSGHGLDMVRVDVSDTGIGIAPENQELIFEKFAQVGDTLTEKPRGTGLGLPICKEIVDHFGGFLWVESELGRGSTFSVALHVAECGQLTGCIG